MIIWKLILIVYFQGTNMAPLGYEVGTFETEETCKVKLEVIKKEYLKSKEQLPPIEIGCVKYGEF